MNNKKKFEFFLTLVYFENQNMEMELAHDYNRMNTQNNKISLHEERTFTSEENVLRQPNRVSRCVFVRENYTQIPKYLFWILVSGWYVVSLVALFRTSYVQERQICPYSEFWTYLVSSLISDSIIIIGVSNKLQVQEELIFPYLPIVYLWKLGLKYLGFSIWGTLIFYSFSCVDKLDNTLLFWVSLYNYLLNIVLVGIIGLVSLKVYAFSDSSDISDEQIEEFANQLKRSRSPNSDEDRSYSFEV